MIKFVYFDVGGVVIDDFSGNDKWVVMKQVIGVRTEFEADFNRLFDSYERKGLCLDLPVDELKPIFAGKLGMKFADNFSWLTYFVDHFDRNEDIWQILEEVSKNYRVGLLCNMYVDMFSGIKNRGLLPNIKWEVIIDSTRVMAQKPEQRIFEIAREKSGVKEEELLFVDNSRANIEAAKNLGWQTFLYDSANHKLSCQELNKFLTEVGVRLY